MLGGERINKHSRCRILTLFHIFLDVCKVRIVLGEMILLTGQAWKLEFPLSLFIIARFGFLSVGLLLLTR